MKVGDNIEVSFSHWRGSPNRAGDVEGVTIRIGPSTFGDPRLELDMSYAEFGKAVIGLGGVSTLERIV